MRVYLFDPGATTTLPAKPAVGIPPGMPFVLDSDGAPVGELNRWLRSLPTAGVPAPKSWTAYAGDLVAWLRFLRQRDLDLLADVASLQDAVAAYHADRRMGDLARRLAPSSWNRAIAAIARFYEWAHAEGLITEVPFRYRVHLVRTDGPAPRVLRRNLAKESQPRPHVTVRWLEEDFLRLFIDVGLAGLLPDGEPDPGFRGREAGRNAAVARFAASSGLRSQEFSHLLVWELPAPPQSQDAELVALVVPGAITKGGKGRTTWTSAQALAELRTYLALERSAAVAASAWSPPEPLRVTEADRRGGRVNGRRVLWASLSPPERRRLVAPGGGTALLAARSDGAPFTDWEYVFDTASERCARFEPRFPPVTPHTLRHTFAVHTLRRLVRQHLADAAKLLGVSGADPAWALAMRAQDPLLVLRDLLGHASVATTEVYLRLIDTTRLFTDAELGLAEGA